MVRIAVTGGIACGKSRMGLCLRHLGVDVCEADDLAHDILNNDTGVYREVVKRFGGAVLGSDGKIDRTKLGEIVFGDSERLVLLNSIIHPVVKLRLREWLQEREQSGSDLAAAIVPLLFEAGMCDGWGWNAIVCVSCSEPVQLERLAWRGFSWQQASQRVAAQMPLAEKEKMSDFVVINNGTAEQFDRETVELLKKVGEI